MTRILASSGIRRGAVPPGSSKNHHRIGNAPDGRKVVVHFATAVPLPHCGHRPSRYVQTPREPIEVESALPPCRPKDTNGCTAPQSSPWLNCSASSTRFPSEEDLMPVHRGCERVHVCPIPERLAENRTVTHRTPTESRREAPASRQRPGKRVGFSLGAQELGGTPDGSGRYYLISELDHINQAEVR